MKTKHEKPTAAELAEFMEFIKDKYPNIAKCIEIVETAAAIKMALHKEPLLQPQNFEKGGHTINPAFCTPYEGESVIFKDDHSAGIRFALQHLQMKQLPEGIAEIVSSNFEDLLLKVSDRKVYEIHAPTAK